MSTHYQIYHESVIKLAATLVIKDTLSCDIVNERVKYTGYELDTSRPETWKYYLNLAGRYHVSDKPMTVTSMDTHEEIDFTVENLDIHRATWREYQYGSRYYKELVKRYPKQDTLINGILNPVDIETAIKAPDHTILYYDKALVEARETNLIPEIQHWLFAQFVRWANIDYRINNAYFLVARLAIIFMALPEQIKSIRLENCRTNRAHSYHIRRYLASFGPLDAHYEYMSDYQRLYFYRNIRHLMRNSGKQETFEELTDNVLTHRRLPLAEYVIQHDDSSILDTLDPTVQYERRSLNGLQAAMGDDIIDTTEMLRLENRIASGNLEESEYAEIYIPDEMMHGKSSSLKTKVLESNILDFKESEPHSSTDILINHWIYWADRGIYRTVLTVPLPDGGEGLRLSMKEAYLLFQYIYFKRSGIEMTTIPKIMAKYVRRIILPTETELKSMLSDTTPDFFIRDALADNVNITSYVSVDSFITACASIERRMRLHHDLFHYRDDLYHNAEIRNMVSRFYMDVPVDLDHGQNYSAWLRDRGIDLEKYNPNELNDIMSSIVDQATGQDLTSAQTLGAVHRSMIGIMTQLSSYSVQYIQNINEGSVHDISNDHLRWHHHGTRSGHHIHLPVETAKILDLQHKAKIYNELDLSQMSFLGIDPMSHHQMHLPIGIDYEISGLNQTLLNAMDLGVSMGTIVETTVDLTAYNGEVVDIPTLTISPIADLFNKVVSDDFANL